MSRQQNRGRSEVYAYRLQGGGVYVGTTRNFRARNWAHLNGRGSRMTQTYPVTSLLYRGPGGKRQEANLVQHYKGIYGRNKVRGAGHTRVPTRRQYYGY